MISCSVIQSNLKFLLSASLIFLIVHCGSRIEDSGTSFDSGRNDSSNVPDVQDTNTQDVQNNVDAKITFCGGFIGTTCKEGEFCDLAYDGTCGDVTDEQGQCKPKPTICTLDIDPVCGCDNQTYSNACVANRAGVGVKKQGKCS